MAQRNGNLVVLACNGALMGAVLRLMASNLAEARRRRRRYVPRMDAVAADEDCRALFEAIEPLCQADLVAALDPRASDCSAVPSPSLSLEEDAGLWVLSLSFETDGGVADAEVTRFVGSLPAGECGIATCHWFEGLDRRLLTSGCLLDGGAFLSGSPDDETASLRRLYSQDSFATSERWNAFLGAYGSAASPSDEYAADAGDEAGALDAQQVANRRLARMIEDADL